MNKKLGKRVNSSLKIFFLPLLCFFPEESSVKVLLDSIPCLISQRDNDYLMQSFSLVELQEVVVLMAPDKSLGPNGFTMLFFQKCWDVLSFDLVMALEESRQKAFNLKNFNLTHLSLIPKSNKPQSFADSRPISLCNTVYKIFTKAIYLRLKSLIPKVISPQQGGFFPSRETSKGVLVAHEALHSINSSQSYAFIVK